MPANTSAPTMQLPESFSISITHNPEHTLRFDQGQIYIGNKLLTLQDQKKFLADYAGAYQVIRRRNYGWRFLSTCHSYFNGQLQHIQQFKTDKEKIQYLFRHAQEKPESKTTEALRSALSLFCATAHNPQSAQQNVPTACLEFKAVSAQNQIACAIPKALPDATPKTPKPCSHCHDRYLRWIGEMFNAIWQLPSIKKVASVQFDPRYLRYYLFFYDNLGAAIAKSNAGFFTAYNPFDHTIKRETSEALWGKQLYDALNHFQQRVDKSHNSVEKIHSAFNELIEQIHLDPPDLDSGYVKNSEFHHRVINLRLQIIDIHIDWRKTVEAETATTQQTTLH